RHVVLRAAGGGARVAAHALRLVDHLREARRRSDRQLAQVEILGGDAARGGRRESRHGDHRLIFCTGYATVTVLLLALLGLGVGTFGTLVGAGGGFILT